MSSPMRTGRFRARPAQAVERAAQRPGTELAEALALPMDEPVHIMLVDDDALFVESLERNLVTSGFRVSHFSDGEEALEFLSGRLDVDLVLLDWKMPGMNGIEVLRRLRSAWPELPVIFLTVLGEQIYEEAALIGGAVDFVEKSRGFSILLKRMENVLARAAGRGGEPEEAKEETVVIGRLSLRPGQARARWASAPVALTLGEFNIVHYMARRAGEDVRYREIYDAVRGQGFAAGAGEEGYRVNVRTAIKRIRRKFRDVDHGFDQIENYPGFGYRWRAER